MRYQAVSLTGRAVDIGTSALSADFGASKLKIPQHPALKRLNAYAARVAAAGGPEVYYGTGGCTGPWGPKGEAWLASKGKRPAAKPRNDRAKVIDYLARMTEAELIGLLRVSGHDLLTREMAS